MATSRMSGGSASTRAHSRMMSRLSVNTGPPRSSPTEASVGGGTPTFGDASSSARARRASQGGNHSRRASYGGVSGGRRSSQGGARAAELALAVNQGQQFLRSGNTDPDGVSELAESLVRAPPTVDTRSPTMHSAHRRGSTTPGGARPSGAHAVASPVTEAGSYGGGGTGGDTRGSGVWAAATAVHASLRGTRLMQLGLTHQTPAWQLHP